MEWLKDQGFEVVEYRIVTADTLDEAMDYFADAVEKNIFPSDGLVALMTILLTGNLWDLQQNSQEMHLHSSGRMRSANDLAQH